MSKEVDWEGLYASKYQYLVTIPAPKIVIETEAIRDGCMIHVAASAQYKLLFSEVMRQVESIFENGKATALLTLQTIGVGEYDHPVRLELRINTGNCVCESDKLAQLLEECTIMTSDSVLPRWGRPLVEEILDASCDSRQLRRRLTNPNDLVIEQQ